MEASINWKDRIVSDPKVVLGKPVVKGTRLSVEFLLGLFAEGWTEQQLLQSYPQLTSADMQALFAFVHDCLKDEEFIMLERAS